MKKYLLGAATAVVGMALALPAAVAQDDMMMEGVSLSGSIKQDIGFGSWDNGQRDRGRHSLRARCHHHLQGLRASRMAA